MFRYIALTAVLLSSIVSWESGREDPVVLEGFDPILLTNGKQVAGKPELSFEFGGFRYLFANDGDRDLFKNAPRRYGIQNEDNCVIHPDKKGIPDFFLVANDKIYLVEKDACMQQAKKIMAAQLKQRANRK